MCLCAGHVSADSGRAEPADLPHQERGGDTARLPGGDGHRGPHSLPQPLQRPPPPR